MHTLSLILLAVVAALLSLLSGCAPHPTRHAATPIDIQQEQENEGPVVIAQDFVTPHRNGVRYSSEPTLSELGQ